MHSQDNDEIKYWRSIDYRKRTEDYVNSIKDEFRTGDSEVTGLQRREMLKLMGASMALAGIGSACRRPEEKILPYTKAPEDVVPGVPNYFATARSSVCGASGLIIESHENRPTKVEGNPDHPISLGAASSQDQASVLELYDPDRSRNVMQLDRASLMPSDLKSWDDFATEHFKKISAVGGEGFAVVYEGHGCPTQDRLLREMKAAMPAMQVYAYDPMQEVNTAKGAELAFGSDARVLNNFENAKVILTVHADPFMRSPAALKNAKGFAHGRKIDSVKSAGKMNRLYSVEANYSVTGTNADHRLRAPVSQGGDFLVALARELGKVPGFSLTLPDAIKSQIVVRKPAFADSKWVTALARDFSKNVGESLIVVGESQEPWVHGLGHALNVALSALDRTITVVKAARPFSDFAGFEGLATLATNLNAKKIKTLIVLNANLAYATPTKLALKEALTKAETLIHCGHYLDETAQFASWHVPMSHFLEAYGDAVAYDGTASIQQPLIAPLHETRSLVEVLNQVKTGFFQKGYEVVKATWQGERGLSADKSFRKSLHDGVVAQSAFPSVAGSLDAAAIALAISKAKPESEPTADAIELLFEFDHRVLDGRMANLGWLQELPDPITKLTWDNALYVSPALAKKMGLKSRVHDRFYRADVVTVTTPFGALDVPAFVVPGLNEYTAVVTFGYGRTHAGTVGSGLGYNAYAIWPISGSRSIQGATLKRTSQTYDLASTQEQFAMNGEAIQEVSTLSMRSRDPARVADVKTYNDNPDYASSKGLPKNLTHKENDKTAPKQVTDPWPYTGNKWGMVIDLTSCIGCNACVTACQSENNIPVVGKTQVMRSRAMHWIRIDRYFTGDVNEPMAIAQPVPCMHCENAPCEPVCPVAATAHDKEGINAMSYNRCVGTRYCGNNCPYKVRRFNYLDFSHSGNLHVDKADADRSKLLSMQLNPDVTVRYRGVMEKCTYCIQRIQEAKITATRNKEDPNRIKDGAVTPACAQTCPTQAITFGNLNDSESRVSKLKLVDRNYDLLNELNVRPRTSYLGKLRNPNRELV